MNRIYLKVTTAFAVVTPFVLSSEALARRSDREGLNFGTNVRLMDADDRMNSSENSENVTRTQSVGQAFSPYLGYSFGELNFGLVGNIENRKETIDEKSSSNQQIVRSSETMTKALSLFGRFNFGKVMFLEAGFGAYTQTTDVHTEYKLSNGDGSFTGKAEEYKMQGIGPGYHLGGGLELPIDNGFYFSASYLVRSYSLRDQTKSEFGDKMGSQQKRELSFGIAYYN